jgi:FlaA1/EpsC-like NDP-sugar epimerase
MDLSEAAKIICLILNSKTTGVSVLKMGDAISITELAARIFARMGKEPEITYIGIKEGEKISEELFSAFETGDVRDLGAFLNCPFKEYLDPAELHKRVPQDDQESREYIDWLLNKYVSLEQDSI